MTSPWISGAVLAGMGCLFAALLPAMGDHAATGSAAYLILLNGGTIGLALRRAAREPRERTGWHLFSAGVLVNLLGRLLWLAFPASPHPDPRVMAFLTATTPLSTVLIALGIWKWPWRRSEGQGLPAFLGALVFCLSFLLLPWAGAAHGVLATGGSAAASLALALSSRLVVAGGLAAFLVAEDPRRFEGPLGWLLLNSALFFLQLTFASRGLNRFDLIAHSPWLALSPFAGGALLMVPLAPRPVEAADDQHRVPARVTGFLLHVPFLIATTVLVSGVLRGYDLGPGVLMVFLGMTAALVLRQFLLQEEVAASRREMEERVRTRTRELERMQDVVLLNERLNAVVVLGAGLVHDLNKGLGSILSAAEVLQMELERRMKVSGFAVEAIIQAVQRSALLSSRVMAFSRRLQEEGEIHDLRRELAALEGLLRLLVPCGVHLLLQPGKEPAPVRIHTEDLKQILINLVSNARDALPAGGTIRLAVGKEERTGETYLDVEDTGVGIRKELHQRIFEPFFTTKEPGAGTGLGLASVKVLLEKAQGRVEVRSELGSGTCFRLVFPPATVGV